MKWLWSKILKNGPLITILVLDSVTSAPQCIRQPRLVVYHTPKQTRRTRSTVVHAARCTMSRYLTLAALCITVLPQVLYTSADSADWKTVTASEYTTQFWKPTSRTRVPSCHGSESSSLSIETEMGRASLRLGDILSRCSHIHTNKHTLCIYFYYIGTCVCVCVFICVFVFVGVTVCVYTYEYYMLFSFWRRDF
jgi:hypothetical protein